MFGMAWALLRSVPGIAALSGGPTGRFPTLDGLRGLLAASVLVHHAYIARRLYAGSRTGTRFGTPARTAY